MLPDVLDYHPAFPDVRDFGKALQTPRPFSAGCLRLARGKCRHRAILRQHHKYVNGEGCRLLVARPPRGKSRWASLTATCEAQAPKLL
jgi:hypothetical protein